MNNKKVIFTYCTYHEPIHPTRPPIYGDEFENDSLGTVELSMMTINNIYESYGLSSALLDIDDYAKKLLEAENISFDEIRNRYILDNLSIDQLNELGTIVSPQHKYDDDHVVNIFYNSESDLKNKMAQLFNSLSTQLAWDGSVAVVYIDKYISTFMPDIMAETDIKETVGIKEIGTYWSDLFHITSPLKIMLCDNKLLGSSDNHAECLLHNIYVNTGNDLYKIVLNRS